MKGEKIDNSMVDAKDVNAGGNVFVMKSRALTGLFTRIRGENPYMTPSMSQEKYHIGFLLEIANKILLMLI